VVRDEPAVDAPPLCRPALRRGGPQTPYENLVDPRAGRRVAPLRPGELGQRPRAGARDVEVAADHDRLVRRGQRFDERGRAEQLGVCEALVGRVAGRVEVRHEDRRPVGQAEPESLADAPFVRPCEARREPEAEPARLGSPKATLVQDDRLAVDHLQRRADEDRVRLAGERRPQQPVVQRRQHAADLGGRGQRAERRVRRDLADRRHPAPVVERVQGPRGNLLEQQHVRLVGDREPHHLLEECGALGRDRVAVEDVPAADEEFQEPFRYRRCVDRSFQTDRRRGHRS
jgi:hypothetical protein